jgi:dipeptidyl aminopeptidase/acylaminoacyl peptidase
MKRASIVFGLALATLTTLATAALAADPGVRQSVRQYQSVVLAPAGDLIADVELVTAPDQTALPHGAIVLRAATGAVLSTLDPCADCRYTGLNFSPDGRGLAFIADDSKAGVASLDVIEDGKLKTLATLKGLAETPRWSPDGQTLALLAVIGAHKEVGATQAGKPLTGEIGADEDEQRIAVVPVAGGPIRLISPADTWVYEYDWTPNGRGFVATAAKGNGDDNWWIAKLIGVDLASGAARVIAAPDYQMNAPRVSPDGATVAFIGGLMSDFGSVGGDLYTVPISGGTPKDITPGYKATFTAFVWRGDILRGSALIGADTANVAVSARTGAVTVEAQAPLSFAAGDGHFSFSADGQLFAAAVSSFERAPAIELHASGEHSGRLITHDNDALQPHVSAKSVTWESEGYSVQGWLLSPRNLAAGKTYPMITLVHGGPSAAATPSYVDQGTVKDLIDHGYLVFEPNPRGSYGQGEAFTRANVRDLGGGDLRDILAGVDAVEKAAPVDDKRLGVFGHSYGGFMTMWSVTHTNRFRAAVAGAGIADWMSYYGENGIDKWMIPFFGASAYDDPAIYDKLSPIRYIKTAKTPTFIYVGERDVECPAAQSIEFWHGLKAMDVPVSLVIYAGEGHGIRKPEDVHDLAHRIVGWFDRYLQSGG